MLNETVQELPLYNNFVLTETTSAKNKRTIEKS